MLKLTYMMIIGIYNYNISYLINECLYKVFKNNCNFKLELYLKFYLHI